VGSDYGRALAADLQADTSGLAPADLLRFWAVLGSRMALQGWGLSTATDGHIEVTAPLDGSAPALANAPAMVSVTPSIAAPRARRDTGVALPSPAAAAIASPSLAEAPTPEAEPHVTAQAQMSQLFAQFADD
jgi:hypothetical protein